MVERPPASQDSVPALRRRSVLRMLAGGSLVPVTGCRAVFDSLTSTHKGSKLSTLATWASAIDDDTALVGTVNRPIGAHLSSNKSPLPQRVDVVTVFGRGSNGWTEETTISPDVDPEFRTSTSTPLSSHRTEVGPSRNGVETFGSGVAVDGDTILLGSEGENLIYEFERTRSGWIQQGSFGPTDTDVEHGVTLSISLDSETALAGSYVMENSRDDAGTAYVFERGSDGWLETATLTADDDDVVDFGDAMALADDTALIGLAKDVGGELRELRGEAAVFERTNGGWTETARLTPMNGGLDDEPVSVALAGDTALVGHRESATSTGTKYGGIVFERESDGWTRTTTLVPDVTEHDEFHVGGSVAIDEEGDTAIVGGKNRGTTNTGFADAFVFTRENDGWTQTATLDLPIDDSEIEPPLGISDDGNTALLQLDEGVYVIDL